MRRISVITIGFATFLLSLAPTAAQAARGTNCPRGFALVSIEVLGEDFVGIADNVNHDGLICLKDLRSGGGIFTDNTAP